MNYEIEQTDEIISPALIYYLDELKRNTEEIIRVAGNTERLWPHVKTHKCIRMVELLMSYGICKFKAATIAEAEMCAMAGAQKIILAYPLVGPSQKRLIQLSKAYPQTSFYAIEDDLEQFQLLSQACVEQNWTMSCLLDINPGLNRTGVALEKAEELYRTAAGLSGLKLQGIHWYDGNNSNPDITERRKAVAETDRQLESVIRELTAEGFDCGIVVAGGTPEMPCHAQDSNWYVSPGTSFINDAGYTLNIPDLNCPPGAAVLTRVVSHPKEGYFTLDLGYKGIAADPPGQRGYIVGLEDAEQVMQNEEHWVWRLKDLSRVPRIGTCLYVIPTHICPTSMLYPEVLIAQDGSIVDHWQVTARNRKLNY